MTESEKMKLGLWYDANYSKKLLPKMGKRVTILPGVTIQLF